jgi:glucokinase
MSEFTKHFYLAGDIGGTNSRFSLFSIEHVCHIGHGQGVPGTLHFRKTYKNDDYPSFLAVLQEFMNDPQSTPAIAVACFGVAGPTSNNRAMLTNRGGWEIDGGKLEAATGITTVSVINDFVAAGYGVLTLDDATECVCLQDAPKLRSAPIAVVGAGTGLGECFMTPVASGPAGQVEYTCFPSEGGHVEFAPKNPMEVELLAYMTELHPARVSVERIVSGAGVAALYDFFALKFPENIDAELHARVGWD